MPRNAGPVPRPGWMPSATGQTSPGARRMRSTARASCPGCLVSDAAACRRTDSPRRTAGWQVSRRGSALTASAISSTRIRAASDIRPSDRSPRCRCRDRINRGLDAGVSARDPTDANALVPGEELLYGLSTPTAGHRGSAGDGDGNAYKRRCRPDPVRGAHRHRPQPVPAVHRVRNRRRHHDHRRGETAAWRRGRGRRAGTGRLPADRGHGETGLASANAQPPCWRNSKRGPHPPA